MLLLLGSYLKICKQTYVKKLQSTSLYGQYLTFDFLFGTLLTSLLYHFLLKEKDIV